MTRRMKLLIAAGMIAVASAAGVAGIAEARDGRRGEACEGPRGGEHAGRHHRGGGDDGWRHGGHHRQGKGRHAMALMERFDGNADGELTQEEIDQARAANLAKFDADGDGQLSLGEFQELWLDFMRERMVDRFQDLDADGDAVVSAEEYERPFARLVQRMDRNDDGKLSPEDRRGPGHGPRFEGRGDSDD